MIAPTVYLPEQDPTPAMVSIQVAAFILGLTDKCLLGWIKRNKMIGYRLAGASKQWRIPLTEVRRLITDGGNDLDLLDPRRDDLMRPRAMPEIVAHLIIGLRQVPAHGC